MALAAAFFAAACRSQREGPKPPFGGRQTDVINAAVHVEVPALCGESLPTHVLDDAASMRELIVAMRLRERTPERQSMCEAGAGPAALSECHRCEMLLYTAIYQFPKIGTDAAISNAASLMLDERMQWDGAFGMTLADALFQFGPRVLPYLRPYVENSAVAAMAVRCIERRARQCV
jgi:hypothetical protein